MRRRKKSLPREQRRVQGKLNLSLLAHSMNEIGMGGAGMGETVRQRVPNSGAISWKLRRSGLLASSKWRDQASRAAIRRMRPGFQRFGEKGKLVASEGPQPASPAFGFRQETGSGWRPRGKAN